ncbi:uncharacterized protein J3D65DRAFT_642381 [Phyllosticta citribraziliensis]|uniref:Uncharacterized protein n=1 Tax=Phyllosticta citribraziliensis TaxID=989973 RepID=A0ABR1L2V9_9PEZI
MSDRVETTTPSSSDSESGSAELTAVVDDLLNQLSTKFQGISKELLDKSECRSAYFFRTPLPQLSSIEGIQFELGLWDFHGMPFISCLLLHHSTIIAFNFVKEQWTSFPPAP